MHLMEEIEQAVSQLSPDELRQFRQWFDEYDARVWDQQFVSDVNSGRLDALADHAIDDYRKGKCQEL